MKGRREDPWSYNKYKIKKTNNQPTKQTKKLNLFGGTGEVEFYRFLAEISMFMEIFEGFCFWTWNLEENQILQLFVFPGMIYPLETD